MPAISVFDLVNTLKDYIHNERSLTSWYIKQIIIPFSKRVKSTKYGYKVVPLEVNIRAYDKSAKTDTKLRLSFESVCEILNNDPHSIPPLPTWGCGGIPYIKVNQTKKDSRKIYEDSFTILDIDCSRIQSFNNTQYYNHKTTPISAQRLTDLNDSVLKVVDERISVYKQSQKQSAESTMQELLVSTEGWFRPRLA